MNLNTDINIQSILKKWRIVTIIAVLFMLISYCHAAFVEKPVYTYSREYTVLNNISYSNDSSSRVGSVNDITVSRDMAETYTLLLKTNGMMQYLAEELYNNFGLEFNYMQLKSLINVSRINESEILKIVVSTSDPQLSSTISAAVENILVPYVNNEIGVTEIKATGKTVTGEVFPSSIRSAIKGLIFGVAFGFILVILIYIFNTKIADKEELEKKFSVPVLGVIPDIENIQKGGYVKYGK